MLSENMRVAGLTSEGLKSLSNVSFKVFIGRGMPGSYERKWDK